MRLQSARRRVNGDGGISLVEALVALSILAFVLSSMAAAGMSGLVSVRAEKDQLGANQFTSEVVERLRAAQWQTVAPAGGAVSGAIPGETRTVAGTTYTSQIAVAWMDDPCNGSTPVEATQDYLRFQVSVSWSNRRGVARQLRTDTYRTPTFNEKRPFIVDTLSC